MKTIQAYRRKKVTTIEWGGMKLLFQPNSLGDIVCDVVDESFLEILAKIPEAYRVYATAANELPVAQEPESSVWTDIVAGLEVAPLPIEVATLPVAEPIEPVVEPIIEPTTDASSPYILSFEGNPPYDLRILDDDQLRAFCVANDIKVSPLAKGDTIRNKIVEALKAPE